MRCGRLSGGLHGLWGPAIVLTLLLLPPAGASAQTNTFSPPAYADYKRFGGEPTVVVDRFPFTGDLAADNCPDGESRCFLDIAYQSAPNGLLHPHYSQFYKSEDLGQTFRKPRQFPVHGLEVTNQGGGGDSHQVVGRRTHKVYFVDLPLDCVTMNVSSDLGETFTSDQLGCGLNPGLDDRQWVEADEAFPATAAQGGNVYVSFINVVNLFSPTLSLARSQRGAAPGTFVTDSVCNTLTLAAGSTIVEPAPDDEPTPCPDPGDRHLEVAGPPVVDHSPTSPHQHDVYIPFIRELDDGQFQLYVAKSDDGAQTWTRQLVANIGAGDPVNIFPQLTIDRAGNLYYTYSQTERADEDDGNFGGEQDVHYTFSTGGGLAGTWAEPINLTGEQNDSAVFPWMVAGDEGRVDLVFYKSDTGINSNVAFVDAQGNACEEGTEGCRPNPSVWNVFFAQSLNALDPGANFNTVKISPHPHHIGQICTAGLACEGDRDLLDFIAFDVDHLGAAMVAYSDDNQQLSISRDRTTRQIAGKSVFEGETINLQDDWPVSGQSAVDRAGDVFDTASVRNDACRGMGMDVLGTSADRRDDLLTITLTLDGAPTAENAIACGRAAASGGIWGAELWAEAEGEETGPANNFYVAYRDDLVDGARVEGGTFDNINAAITSLEPNSRTQGTLGGSCLPEGGPPAAGPCTISMTVEASALGIKPGSSLDSITGLSLYFFGDSDRVPLTRLILGNSEQADAAPAFHIPGSSTP